MARRAEQQRAIQRRRTILDATADIMLNEGLHEVTHRQVATRAEVPVGSIGYYFDTRENLIRSCLEMFGEDSRARFAGVGELSEPSTDSRVIATELLDVLSAGRPEISLGMVSAFVQARRESPALAELVQKLHDEVMEYASKVLELHGLNGDFAAEILRVMLGAVAFAHLADQDAQEAALGEMSRAIADQLSR